MIIKEILSNGMLIAAIALIPGAVIGLFVCWLLNRHTKDKEKDES